MQAYIVLINFQRQFYCEHNTMIQAPDLKTQITHREWTSMVDYCYLPAVVISSQICPQEQC